MSRITFHISPIALLVALCMMGPAATCAFAATGASSTSINKAALDKAVQEALAKGKLGTSAGAQNAAAAGAETPASGEVFSAPSESSSSLTSGVGEEEEAAQTTATTSSSTSSISTGVVVPVLIVCILLLGGIALFIVRDARGVTPAGDSFASGASVQERAARQRKRRAKAKAARQQRKRNR
jgi:cobalamin biosynthesis Mg chelatase CobN